MCSSRHRPVRDCHPTPILIPCCTNPISSLHPSTSDTFSQSPPPSHLFPIYCSHKFWKKQSSCTDTSWNGAARFSKEHTSTPGVAGAKEDLAALFLPASTGSSEVRSRNREHRDCHPFTPRWHLDITEVNEPHWNIAARSQLGETRKGWESAVKRMGVRGQLLAKLPSSQSTYRTTTYSPCCQMPLAQSHTNPKPWMWLMIQFWGSMCLHNNVT